MQLRYLQKKNPTSIQLQEMQKAESLVGSVKMDWPEKFTIAKAMQQKEATRLLKSLNLHLNPHL